MNARTIALLLLALLCGAGAVSGAGEDGGGSTVGGAGGRERAEHCVHRANDRVSGGEDAPSLDKRHTPTRPRVIP